MKNKLSLLLLLFAVKLLFLQNTISLSDFPDNKVMVVAHRGDWREAPENSIWAVKKAIEKGVNKVELDLALTKDSILILMHDRTIDRTTTGVGKPGDYTFAELQRFNLKDGIGSATQMKIPTMEEVLEVTYGRILINLDKGFDYINLVFPILKSRNMLDQVLFKGTETYKEFEKKYGNIKNEIHFMPIIRLGRNEGWSKINEYLDHYKVYGFEFTIGNTEENMLDFATIRSKGMKVWVNSLWPQHNASHQDDLALENLGVYDWYINKKINIIQTDRPKELIDYLKNKNLHFQNENSYNK